MTSSYTTSDEFQRRDAYLRDKYGMGGLLEYEAMVQRQEGKCAICGYKPKLLVVDHDHETEEIRALLCPFCNTGLGLFSENPEVLLHAISYLNEHRKNF